MSTNVVPFKKDAAVEKADKNDEFIVKMQTEAISWKNQVLLLAITDAESLKVVEDQGSLGATAKSNAQKYFKPFKAAASKLHKDWCVKENSVVGEIDAGLRHLSAQKSAYQTKLNLEAAARALAEKAQREDAVLIQAAALENAGLTDMAQQLMETPVSVEKESTKLDGTSNRYKADIEDLPTLLRAIADGKCDPAFLVEAKERIIDGLMPLLNRYATLQKELMSIPGVKAKIVTGASFRKVAL
jgi:hypothetical protein